MRSLMPSLKLSKFFIYIFLLIVAEVNSANGQSSNTETESINRILEIVCGAYERSGSNKEIELNGQAKVEINSILKRLADAGANLSGSFNVEQYVGLLQSDLQRDRSLARDCRERVWKDLKDKIQIASSNKSETPIVSQPNTIKNQIIKSDASARELTGKSIEITEYLKLDGIREKKHTFFTKTFCQITIVSFDGPGLNFEYSLDSDTGVTFLESISGKDSRRMSTSAPAGTYVLTIRTIKQKGNYSLNIGSSC